MEVEEKVQLEADQVVDPPEVFPEGEAATEQAEEVLNVSVGDQAEEGGHATEEETPLIKKMRKLLREKEREVHHLKKEVESNKVITKPKLGEKPTLEACEYDPEVYESKLADWFKEKQQVEEAERKEEEAAKEQENAFRSRIEAYHEAKRGLKLKDFDEVEADLMTVMDKTQAAILVKAAKRPELVVYALGKNLKKASELAGIKDPIDFAVAIRDLEKDEMKVEKKPVTPPPERVVKGSGGIKTSDSTLEKLREEADRTGDYSKVVAWKRANKT